MNYKEYFRPLFSTFDIISNEHAKLSDWICALENDGYKLNNNADIILQNVGGLKIAGYGKTSGEPIEFYFNPVYFTNKDYYCISTFNEAANDTLFPIGGVSDFTILVGEKGTFYIATWKDLIECGDSFQSFLENMTSDNPFLKEVYHNPMYPFELYFGTLLAGFEVLSIEHEKVYYWVKELEKEGYEINDVAKRILHKIGGLSFKGIGKNNKLQEVSFDPTFYASGDYELNMSEYLNAANDSLFPIGYWYDYTIFVGRHGKYYIARPFDMFECGNSFNEFIESVFSGKSSMKPLLLE